MPRATIFKLPQLLDRKIYKTGQTRGADDDVTPVGHFKLPHLWPPKLPQAGP